jgi:hypothetical protein
VAVMNRIKCAAVDCDLSQWFNAQCSTLNIQTVYCHVERSETSQIRDSSPAAAGSE